MTVLRKLELGLALVVRPMPLKSTTLGSRLTKLKGLRGPPGALSAFASSLHSRLPNASLVFAASAAFLPLPR